jgi:hypothetical protein
VFVFIIIIIIIIIISAVSSNHSSPLLEQKPFLSQLNAGHNTTPAQPSIVLASMWPFQISFPTQVLYIFVPPAELQSSSVVMHLIWPMKVYRF